MAELTVQPLTAVSVDPTYAAAAGGGDDFVPSNSYTPHVLHVKNGGGSPITVTVDDPTSTGPTGAAAFNPDLSFTVAASDEKLVALNPSRFIDPATGRVEITYSDVTSVTVAVFRIDA